MRFPASVDANGYTTLVVVNAFGDGDHGHTDGNAVLFDATLGVNGDATEMDARLCNDLVRNIKYACREGNGEDGVSANAINDTPYELASAVNRAGDPLWGSSSFVASGLRFDVSGGSRTVGLAAGIFVFEGRKYHATEARLGAITVQVDGADAGTGESFTLLASRDHYISIGPATDTTLSITVQDVALGAGAPSVPANEFFFAMIATDGTDVTSYNLMNYGPTIHVDAVTSAGVRVRPTSSSGNSLVALEPSGTSSCNLGAHSSPDVADTAGGHYFGTVYSKGRRLRTSHLDGVLWFADESTAATSTNGAVSATMEVLDLDNYADGSLVEIQVTVMGYSTTNSHSYTRSFAQLARRNNGGTMGLIGSLVTTRTEYDSGALGLASSLIASVEGDNSRIQIQVTGAAANTIDWFAYIRTVEMGA